MDNELLSNLGKNLLIDVNRLIDPIKDSSVDGPEYIRSRINIKPHYVRYMKQFPWWKTLANELREIARQTTVVNIVAKGLCRAEGNVLIEGHYTNTKYFKKFRDSIESVTRRSVSFHEHFIDEMKNWSGIKQSISDELLTQYNTELQELSDGGVLTIRIKTKEEIADQKLMDEYVESWTRDTGEDESSFPLTMKEVKKLEKQKLKLDKNS